MTDRFFRVMTNLAVTHSLSNESMAMRSSSQLSYLALDAYVRLIALLVNGETAVQSSYRKWSQCVVLCHIIEVTRGTPARVCSPQRRRSPADEGYQCADVLPPTGLRAQECRLQRPPVLPDLPRPDSGAVAT